MLILIYNIIGPNILLCYQMTSEIHDETMISDIGSTVCVNMFAMFAYLEALPILEFTFNF